MSDWPVATLDPVQRLRVMAAALPGTGLVERVLDAPYDDVTAMWDDLETSVPDLDPIVRSVRILRRDGDRLRIEARQMLMPVPVQFDVELLPGWCWMQSRLYVVGMAAVPVGDDRTHYAHLEGAPWRIARLARPLMRRLVRLDVAGVERVAQERRR
ncbi:MAG: hypothetical protein QOG87_3275 [Actinomycetota bacterium]|jgi:hypothetical protein